jgi:hypothetical protein
MGTIWFFHWAVQPASAIIVRDSFLTFRQTLKFIFSFCLSVSGKLDELDEGKHPHQEKEPLPPWPNNTNPNTGEVGGPRGPEPTRYGDWERKGRVTDF